MDWSTELLVEEYDRITEILEKCNDWGTDDNCEVEFYGNSDVVSIDMDELIKVYVADIKRKKELAIKRDSEKGVM